MFILFGMKCYWGAFSRVCACRIRSLYCGVDCDFRCAALRLRNSLVVLCVSDRSRCSAMWILITSVQRSRCFVLCVSNCHVRSWNITQPLSVLCASECGGYWDGRMPRHGFGNIGFREDPRTWILHFVEDPHGSWYGPGDVDLANGPEAWIFDKCTLFRTPCCTFFFWRIVGAGGDFITWYVLISFDQHTPEKLICYKNFSAHRKNGYMLHCAVVGTRSCGMQYEVITPSPQDRN